MKLTGRLSPAAGAVLKVPTTCVRNVGAPGPSGAGQPDAIPVAGLRRQPAQQDLRGEVGGFRGRGAPRRFHPDEAGIVGDLDVHLSARTRPGPDDGRGRGHVPAGHTVSNHQGFLRTGRGCSRGGCRNDHCPNDAGQPCHGRHASSLGERADESGNDVEGARRSGPRLRLRGATPNRERAAIRRAAGSMGTRPRRCHRGRRIIGPCGSRVKQLSRSTSVSASLAPPASSRRPR